MTASNPGGLSSPATGAEPSRTTHPGSGLPASGSVGPTGAGEGLPAASLERSIARLLTVGTYLSVGLLTIGAILMLATSIGPLSGGPSFDPGSLGGDLAALRPAAFIWLGLVVVIATPSARVAASLVGYARRGDRPMAVVAALILTVIAISVALARGLEG